MRKGRNLAGCIGRFALRLTPYVLRITPSRFSFSIPRPLPTLARVTSPLALLLYERLLPGSALGNKLRDQGYRILHVSDLAGIAAVAGKEKPLVAFVDLEWKATDACTAIRALKEDSATQHLPILAFSSPRNVKLQQAALTAGATIIASDEAILAQLPAMLDQAMLVE